MHSVAIVSGKPHEWKTVFNELLRHLQSTGALLMFSLSSKRYNPTVYAHIGSENHP
jgi:hypothetical protein